MVDFYIIPRLKSIVRVVNITYLYFKNKSQLRNQVKMHTNTLKIILISIITKYDFFNIRLFRKNICMQHVYGNTFATIHLHIWILIYCTYPFSVRSVILWYQCGYTESNYPLYMDLNISKVWRSKDQYFYTTSGLSIKHNQ